MHIPDGFLSAPVWATLDVAAAPAVAYLAHRAQRGFEQTRAPLLGVMGAFVFAAQMINFPVGIGTSGHLVGGALLAYTLGPAAAAVVMTAILAIQALIFQDGGVLALGANVLNMAVLGIFAACLPFSIWGQGRWRKAAIFLGGVLSVLVSAALAVTELLLSGIAMPSSVLSISFGLFVVSALLEGFITLAVISALESTHPGLVRSSPRIRRFAVGALGLAAVALAVVGVSFASTHPDGLERLVQKAGLAAQAQTLFATPLADYQAAFLEANWLRKAVAGLAGLTMVYGACMLLRRFVAAHGTRHRNV